MEEKDEIVEDIKEEEDIDENDDEERSGSSGVLIGVVVTLAAVAGAKMIARGGRKVLEKWKHRKEETSSESETNVSIDDPK